MKKPTLIALATATTCLAGDPVFTEPVGHVKMGNTTAGQDAVAANTDVNLAIPLEAERVFAGQVASTTAYVPADPGPEASATLTVQGTPAWTTDEWAPSPGTPYCVVINSGAENGIRGVITSNSADTLSLTITTPGDITNIASGDSIEIRKCWTLSTIFAGSTLTDNCEVLVYDETKDGINHSSGGKFIFFGGIWYDAFNQFAVANDAVIHPGERFVLRSQETAIPALTLFGDVPTADSRIDLTKDGTGAEDVEVGLASPTPVIVGDLTIPAEDNDEILVFDNADADINKSSSGKLIYFGGQWYDAFDNFNIVTTTYALPPGQGFVFRRASTSSSLNTEWTEPAPYNP